MYTGNYQTLTTTTYGCRQFQCSIGIPSIFLGSRRTNFIGFSTMANVLPGEVTSWASSSRISTELLVLDESVSWEKSRNKAKG